MSEKRGYGPEFNSGNGKRDYYDVLGVPKNATPEEIRNAWKKLAVQYHPDKNPGDAAAEEKFKEAAEAYGTLGDEAKRRKYDFISQTRGSEGFSASAGEGRASQSPPFTQREERPEEEFGQQDWASKPSGGSDNNKDKKGKKKTSREEWEEERQKVMEQRQKIADKLRGMFGGRKKE